MEKHENIMDYDRWMNFSQLKNEKVGVIALTIPV